MSKVATAKQTGQGGTSYEDKVVAYFLACMLSENLPFDPQSGLIKKISLQAGADGWLFDDILLTLESSQTIRRIAVSVKSNQQFNSKGCPAEINRLLWEQTLHHNSLVFNKDSDALCLVEAPISPAASADLNQLLQQAVHQDKATLHQRILTDRFYSKSGRKIYQSFYCPPDLAALYTVREEDTVNLLKCFMEREMDFENKVSKDEARAIELCRNSLSSKNQADAERLFKALCLLPRSIAPVAGSLDRKGLVQVLKNDFLLSNAPRYESDWKKLNQAAADKFLIIPDKLGQQLSLDRNASGNDLENKLSRCKGLIIQGISGSGKTNLAKLFAERKRAEGSSIIWLDSTDFDSTSMETDMRLDNQLSELIEETSDVHAYLFIDGIERLYHQRQQQKLAIILRKAIDETSSWKIIFTCPSDQIDKLSQFFTNFNFSPSIFQNFEIPELTFNELCEIATAYPLLEQILFIDSMENIRNNLKLLDKLIRNANNLSSLSATHNLGESHLIDFVWTEEVENANNGLQISSFLKQLAEQQADNLSIGISVHLFAPDKLAPADALRSLGFLKVQHEKLYFNHDLYSDWARYRLLKSYDDELPTFLKQKHLTSPLWAKAVRLYGISLLEQEPTGAQWEKVVQGFTDNSPQHLLVRDLLLEAFFFAPNAYSLLTLHRELLFTNEAALLKGITKLFLLRATHAAPHVLEIAKRIGITEKQASAYDRLPIPEYWPDVLKFLWEQSEIVLEYDLINTVEIASLWLEKTPEKFPLRQEAGNLSLKAAEQIFSIREGGGYIDDKIEEPVYKALLLGYLQNPEQVRNLCLRICKRIKIEPDARAVENKGPEQGVISVTGRGFSRRKTDPWPLGPLDRIDSAFRKVCLEGRTILPILQYDPSLGSEMLLAVMIEEPEASWYSSDRFNDHYELIEEHGWYPPFYLRGPFLNFLRLSPLEALSFICKLTDFATERWLESHNESSNSNKIEIIIEGKSKEYIGDFYVFGWHKDVGNAPHSLVSVLMALEQFFYEELEKDKNIDEYTSYLIKNTNSLAIIGVIFTIGKLHFPLFLERLKPFLSTYEFYEWDLHSGYHDLTMWGDFSQAWQEQVKKWKGRHHRKIAIRDIVLHLLLNNGEFQKDFVPVREKWQSELLQMQTRNERDIFLYQLIHQTNPANYEKKVSEQGTYFEYQEPVEVTDHLSAGRKASLETLQDSHLAYKYQLMIDQKSPFELAGAEYLWSKIQTDYAKIDPESDSHCSGEHAWASPYTNVLAAVKVLVHHKDIWIDKYPDYWDWVLDLMKRIIDKQFLWGNEFQHYGTHQEWNIFLAEIAPVLWKSNIDSKSMRRVIAGSLLLFNDATRKHFFTTASALYSWDTPHFVQAQNLLLYYSGEYYRGIKNYNEEKGKLKKTREELAEKFINNKIETFILDWSVIRSPEEWKQKETDNWRRNSQDRVRKAGLTTSIIIPMLEVIPELSAIKGNTEKTYIVSLWEQAYKQIIYQLGEIKEDSLPIKSSESEFDRMVLQKIAKSILFLGSEEVELRFWEPLFKYGYIAQKWIQTFCNSFYVNLDTPDIRDKMVKLLNQMVEYTYTSSTWETKHIDRFSDFRICIMGFHPWMCDVWKYDYSAFTSAAEPIYKKWFSKKKWNPYVIDSLLSFITTPSGKFMLKDGLRILTFFFQLSLHQSQQKAPEGLVWVGHKDLDDKLATCLSALWQYFSDNMKTDKESYVFYRELIQYLIAMKNVVGIELQKSLIED
ncbi:MULTISPECIES: AAA family ATPase [unclassified Chitinophaga]|uniref:AAA family ATPase n=1 Tax=unclassified Chitinophaga TaxID=2619133 RepID=UPI0030100711